MRNFLLLFFVCVGLGVIAQPKYNLEFTNPVLTSGGAKLQVTLSMSSNGSFGLGTNNLRFNYNTAALANPVLVSENFGSDFGTTTTTGSVAASGTASINTPYTGLNNMSSITVGATKIDLAVVEFTIINVNNTGNLTWRTPLTVTANPRTAIVDDDKVTIIVENIVTNMADAIALPITLTSFAGKANGEVNTLRWEVASQSNVSHFEVERSADGVNNFRAVTENVIAAGTTNLKMTYSADDKAPISMGYYRLVSVDKDGTRDYSKVITIDRRNKKFAVVEVTPNPTTDAIRVNFDVKTKGEVSVSLTDALGRVVMTQNQATVAGNNNLSLDMSSLASGTYYLSLSDGVNSTVEKVVKQ